MDIRRGVATTGVVLAAAIWGTSLSQAAPSCVPVQPGQARTLLDRVPALVSAQMTATSDGGAVTAFASFRGTREFPGRNFTVLALDSSGCVRWRASLPGPWPIAQPVQAGAGSIVVASAALRDPQLRFAGGLRVYTLSASTGRILHRDVFPSLGSTTGYAPTLLSDRRGDVAVVLATAESSGPVTLTLTRRAHATRWRRRVIARSNTKSPAAVARSDGKLVVGYPRDGRFWVRTGTMVGRLGAATDAGPVSRNFQGAAVALGGDGTIAAVWQSATYSHPWRLRAAVRPATETRFATFAQLGFATSSRGSFFGGPPPAVWVGADGRVAVGFGARSTTPGALRVMCANATPAGRFDPARQVADGGPRDPLDQAAMLFGPAGSAVVVASVPSGDALMHSLVTVDAGCQPRSAEPLDPAAGAPRQAVVDALGRVWVLGQDRGSVSSRRPLRLTIATPTR